MRYCHSLVVYLLYQHLWGKSKGKIILSLSVSVHPTVPQKQIPMIWAWGNYFPAL